MLFISSSINNSAGKDLSWPVIPVSKATSVILFIPQINNGNLIPIDVGCGGVDVCEVEVGYTFISSLSLMRFTMRNFI